MAAWCLSSTLEHHSIVFSLIISTEHLPDLCNVKPPALEAPLLLAHGLLLESVYLARERQIEAIVKSITRTGLLSVDLNRKSMTPLTVSYYTQSTKTTFPKETWYNTMWWWHRIYLKISPSSQVSSLYTLSTSIIMFNHSWSDRSRYYPQWL